ncbi:MAG TPA: hypothetical protein HA224_01110 [Nanoarchaeota archaeon]|nr:hypothetical protein [Nanoarchaeota archaeon]
MKNKTTIVAVIAILLVAGIGLAGIVNIAGTSGITGAVVLDRPMAGFSSDGVLSIVVVLLGIGLCAVYLKKNNYF